MNKKKYNNIQMYNKKLQVLSPVLNAFLSSNIY